MSSEKRFQSFWVYVLSFIFGMVLVLLGASWVWLVVLGVLLVACGFRNQNFILLSLVLLLGWCFQSHHLYVEAQKALEVEPYKNQLLVYDGIVCSHPKTSHYATHLELCIKKVNEHEKSKPFNVKVRASFYTYQHPKKGDHIRIRGRIQQSKYTQSWQIKVSEDDRWAYFKDDPSRRAHILDQVKTKVSVPSYQVFKAIALGSSSDLDYTLKKILSELGLIHLFVFSGFHVGVLFGLIFFVVYGVNRALLFFNQHWLCKQRCLPIAWVFTSLFLWTWIGYGVPTFRAWIFLTVFIVSYCWGYKNHIFNVYMFAVWFVLLVNPGSLTSPSALLSFSAVAGILWSMHLTRHQAQSIIAKNFVVCTAAFLWTTPLIVLFFGYVNVISFLYNMILVPTFGVVIISASIGLLMLSILGGSFWIEKVAWFYNGLIDAFLWIIEGVSKKSIGLVEIKITSSLWLLLVYGCYIITYLYFSNQSKKKVLKRI